MKTYAACLLPPIHIGEPVELTYAELREVLRNNLTARDFEEVERIRFFYDLENIRALWLHQPQNLYGNWAHEDLEEVLVNSAALPTYLAEFLDEHDEPLLAFPLLLRKYFEREIERSKGFVKEYLTFEREWRLTLAGFRAKKLGRDIAEELKFEDPTYDLVMQMIMQKDSIEFEPPHRFYDLKPLFEGHVDEPFALHKALAEWRYKRLDAMVGVNVMSLDRILGYLAKLIAAEEWLALDEEQGKQLLEQIIV